MGARIELDRVFSHCGCTDFKYINPREIVSGQWVRFKCMFGCGHYGRRACCPPNLPSVSECRQLFDEYETCVVLQFAKKLDNPEDRFAWGNTVNERLLSVEREVFLMGYPKTTTLAPCICYRCEECAGVREKCKHPRSVRPAPEGMAIDVFSTVRKCGLPVAVLTDHSMKMNRYGFLFID